ncbi:tyrosine-type recombinase/integrase [Kordiimonas sp.]|uniref:tyrosine-type recombinase/integrase n=1 Tax=Kordiimonas sp. TaxID=1970157 RepID=UPI003A92455F
MADRISLVLRYDDWPPIDRAKWVDLFADGDLFDGIGACHHWSEGSRVKRQQAYGQWLSFLIRRNPEALALPPIARVRADFVRAYLDECEERLRPQSVSNLIGDLYEVAQAMAPEADWSWLRLAARRLLSKASRCSLPPAPDISAREIWRWSLSRLERLDEDTGIAPLRLAIHYRQALMIGFLISRPVRRRALLAMTVTDHLRRGPKGFVLHFSKEDMKDKKGRTAPLPKELIFPMTRYLETHRPVLLADSTSPFLWISQYGMPLTADGLSRELPKVTERHLGVALRPHAFRHIAATSIAETDPAHVNIIRDILGHATLDMSQKHYNRASGISSCNKLQSIMEDIRSDLPRIQRPIIKRRKRVDPGPHES